MFVLRIEVTDGVPDDRGDGAVSQSKAVDIRELAGSVELVRIGAAAAQRPPQTPSEVAQFMADVSETLCLLSLPAALSWRLVVSTEELQLSHVHRVSVVTDPAAPWMYSLIFEFAQKVRVQ